MVLPRLSSCQLCAFADHVQHLVHVQPGLLAKGDGFRQTLHQPGDADLVDHLGELAGTGFTEQGERA
jgi:hypothetical protein